MVIRVSVSLDEDEHVLQTNLSIYGEAAQRFNGKSLSEAFKGKFEARFEELFEGLIIDSIPNEERSKVPGI
jgi:hypothetical protein